MYITDYYSEDIIYNFQANGILSLTGAENIGYPQDNYEYIFGEDFSGGEPSSGEDMILIVKIQGTKWAYSLINHVMSLSITYVDGPILFFERNFGI